MIFDFTIFLLWHVRGFHPRLYRLFWPVRSVDGLFYRNKWMNEWLLLLLLLLLLWHTICICSTLRYKTVRGALWWLCQSHRVNYANHQHSPGGSTTLQTPSSPLSFNKSFMKIHSNVPENGCVIFFCGRKKNKNKQKNICKTYTLPHHRRLRKLLQNWSYLVTKFQFVSGQHQNVIVQSQNCFSFNFIVRVKPDIIHIIHSIITITTNYSKYMPRKFRMSVRLSHACIVSKPLNTSLKFFQCPIGPLF